MALELRLVHRGGRTSRCRVRLASPERQAARLAALFDEYLARQPLQEPVRGCVLRSGELLEYQPDNHGL